MNMAETFDEAARAAYATTHGPSDIHEDLMYVTDEELDRFFQLLGAAAEALATHRAVELAEKVIGEDEPAVFEATIGVMGGPNYGGITRNHLRAEQRQTLRIEQIKGLEGK